MASSILKTGDPNLQVIAAVLIGLDLAKELDIDEQNILSNLLNIVTAVLATIASIGEAAQKDKEEPGAEKPGKEETAEGGGVLPHVPIAAHTTPEAHARLMADQGELRRQMEKLQQQVSALESRLGL